MTYAEALAYVHSLKRFGAAPGLDRMRLLMDRLGNPQDRLAFVHIAGTNGKGSCTAMTARALQTAGYRTGMYISPYVVEFRERFQINGQWIPEGDFIRLLEQVRKEIQALEEQGLLITEFECNTALAFLWFAEEACDVVALEVGLGGRFDATNVISCPLVSVIMAIGLDHTAILGDTVEKIASEKAGIIKGGTTVLYPVQEPEALAAVMEKCAETGSTLIFPNAGGVEILSSDSEGSDFRWNGETYRVGLAGSPPGYFRTVSGILAGRKAGPDGGPVPGPVRNSPEKASDSPGRGPQSPGNRRTGRDLAAPAQPPTGRRHGDAGRQGLASRSPNSGRLL